MAILPLGGALGAYFAGWASDRFFGSRRAPVIVLMLSALGVLTLLYNNVATASFTGTLLLLGSIGFMIYGPHVMMVGAAPQDFTDARSAAGAAGFVNAAGYLGAVLGDLLTGYLRAQYGDWRPAVFCWAGAAFLGAIIMLALWNAAPRPEADE